LSTVYLLAQPSVGLQEAPFDSDADFSIFSFQQVTVAQCHPSFETGIYQLQMALKKYFPISNPSSVRGNDIVIYGEQPKQPFDSWLTGIGNFSIDLLSKYRNVLRPQVRELLLQDDLSEAEFLARAGLMSSGRLFAPGILLFCDYPHILSPSAFTRCVQYGGKNRSASQDSEEYIGPLLYQIEQAMRFIESRIQKVEVLVPGIVAARIEYQYPMICFREVLANALCHRDYSDREQHIHVRLFSDRIEVVSPGSWVITNLEIGIRYELSKLESDHRTRNPRLANALRWIRIVETEGSGIPNAISDCREKNAPEPVVICEDSSVRVVIFPRDNWDKEIIARRSGLVSLPSAFSCRQKIEFGRRLGEHWPYLADYFDIPDDQQKSFAPGREPYGIWEWLAARNRLAELPEALLYIGREDILVDVPKLPSAPEPQRHEFAELPEPQRREIIVRYYQDCVTRWSDDRYALDKRFVQLTLLLDQGEDASGSRWQTASVTFRDLREVLENVEEEAVVVLGPPASGKSTLLRHYELDCARAALAGRAGDALSQAPLTFFVPLNLYRPAPSDNRLPLPFDWLAEQWTARYPDLPALDTLLRERRLMLLLDALNEIPSAGAESVRLWKAFLAQLQRDYPGNRVVFSCRSLDYSVSLSSKEQPVPHVRIEPLSDAQVQEFVARYCPEHAATLWQNLQNTPQLELLRSPYYLKLLITQTTAGEIPAGRAALFTGFVRHALRREVEGDNVLLQPGALLHARDVQRLSQGHTWPPFALPERGILIPKLSALAFQMQTQRTANEAAQVRIAYDEALVMLDHPSAEDILKAGGSLGVLDENRSHDEVLYVHQLLQEYFAARQLARQPQGVLVQQEWRTDHVVPSLQKTLYALADADPLPPLPSTGWEGTMVLAAAMANDPERFVADLIARNLALAGRCAAQPEVALSAPFKEQVRQALVARTQDPGADLRARIAAGLALGELGDPRFARRQGSYDVYLLPPLIEIPGETYRIGSNEGLYEDEAPMHDVTLGPFAIGQFPVTNAEWALFMQAGGYEDERWWETDAARAWRRGEGAAEGPKQDWREKRKYFQDNFDRIRQLHREGRITSQQAEDWEAIARMHDNDFETLLAEWYPAGRQIQPAFWNDDAFNNPAQPVVGICWFEAQAYCAWLSAQTGQRFQLPTEVQWEAAAHGTPHRRYAFGNDFDSMCCNTFETHIRRTTPVGVFPSGTTSEGLVDITGNTWDWTSSLFQPYPYNAEDGREDPTLTGAHRVLRGGAWFDNLVNVRTFFRSHSDPGTRNNGVGLRVLRSSPNDS
jgi:formylglycine-generating enzyme required for sulfatase activity